jgi:hypothetical protein
MIDRRADFDRLVKATAADTKRIRVKPSTPPTIEANRMPPVSLNSSLCDEIRERVSNFKAHQARFSREREEFAASQLKRMLERTPPADRNG